VSGIAVQVNHTIPSLSCLNIYYLASKINKLYKKIFQLLLLNILARGKVLNRKITSDIPELFSENNFNTWKGGKKLKDR
jgi:hypothetical protein